MPERPARQIDRDAEFLAIAERLYAEYQRSGQSIPLGDMARFLDEWQTNPNATPPMARKLFPRA